MYAESMPIGLKGHQIVQVGTQYQIRCAEQDKNILLSSLEYQYFQPLSSGQSIEQIVAFFLKQGWLVSFRVFFGLLEKLVAVGLILQKEIIELVRSEYLTQNHLKPTSLGVQHTKQVHLNEVTFLEVSQYPFFRDLPKEMVSMLLKEARLYQVPRGVFLVKQGDSDRDLFVLKTGQALVVQKNKVLAVLPEFSVFGEGAFFLAKPRSADVIAALPSEVLRIKYSPEMASVIKPEKAEKLQKRFWALHGLLNSQLFNSLPIETFDRFLMLGNVRIVPPQLVLIQEGQPGHCFYILIRGEIQITQRGVPLRKLGAGAVLGEVALMVSQGVRTATAVTLSECHLIEVGQQEFYKNLAQNLILAKEIEEIAFLRFQNL